MKYCVRNNLVKYECINVTKLDIKSLSLGGGYHTKHCVRNSLDKTIVFSTLWF